MNIETKALARRQKLKKAARAAILGAVLALICRALPPEYQTPCETVIKLCTGGL